MLPNLSALAHGAHDAEAPTGLSLEDLPLVLRQLVTEHFIADNAGKWDSMCRALHAWCKADERACTSPRLWKEAFEAAFGLFDRDKDPTGFWNDFAIAYPGVALSDPLPYSAMFKATCELFSGFVGPPFQNVANWTDAMLDRALNNYVDDDEGDEGARLAAFLRMRGANESRYDLQGRLELYVLSSGWILALTKAQELLDDHQLDPDYVIPRADALQTQPHSLLHALLVRNDYYGVDTYKLAKLLLEHKANPNGVDVHGHQLTRTTLHLVISNEAAPSPNALAMFKLLLEHGADPTREDPEYGTPRQLLVAVQLQGSHDEMLEALDAEIAKRAAAASDAAAPHHSGDSEYHTSAF